MVHTRRPHRAIFLWIVSVLLVPAASSIAAFMSCRNKERPHPEKAISANHESPSAIVNLQQEIQWQSISVQ